MFCETKPNSQESTFARASFKNSCRAPACNFIKKVVTFTNFYTRSDLVVLESFSWPFNQNMRKKSILGYVRHKIVQQILTRKICSVLLTRVLLTCIETSDIFRNIVTFTR